MRLTENTIAITLTKFLTCECPICSPLLPKFPENFSSRSWLNFVATRKLTPGILRENFTTSTKDLTQIYKPFHVWSLIKYYFLSNKGTSSCPMAQSFQSWKYFKKSFSNQCSLLGGCYFSNPNINYINYMKDILYPVIKPLFYLCVLIY